MFKLSRKCRDKVLSYSKDCHWVWKQRTYWKDTKNQKGYRVCGEERGRNSTKRSNKDRLLCCRTYKTLFQTSSSLS